MKSLRDPDFDKLFARLPPHIQELARKAYSQWQTNHWHPSLQFKSVGGPLWSVRVGKHHRALGIRDGDKIAWYWIGPHGTYDKLLRQ